jgi:Ni/Co efflux regulator RcnB
MKKFLIAALAASVVATPVLAAPHNRYYNHHEMRHDNRGHVQYRSWHRGDRFDRRYARNYRVISNPRAYRLHAAPRGYRWVQSGNDAVLIGITTGIIASVVANSFR